MVGRQIISFVRRRQMSFEELLHRVGVPLIDRQSFGHIPVVIDHFHNRVQSSNVFDCQVRELCRTITLHERLNLWIGTEFACADFQNGSGVFFGGRKAGIFLTAFVAMVPANELILC